MKKILFLFLLALLPMMASADSSGTCGANGDNLTWTYVEATKTLTISGTGRMYDYAIYDNAPWYSLRNSIKKVIINGGTYIGKYAFYNCSGLTSVTIPNIVKSIGQGAFYKSGLTSVTLNSDAFVSYDLRDKDRSFKYYFGNEVKEYIIGNDVTSISRYAFYGCSGLTSVHIPNSVTSIGFNAFYGCSGLTSVTIPNSVTKFDESAFQNCSGLTSVTLNNDYIVSADRASDTSLKSIFGKQVKEYVIGDGVTSIGDYAFSSCSGLTSVNIPNSVTTIGSSAFSGCSSLTSVNIPNSVTTIGNYAFQSCSGLTTITIPNSVTSFGKSAFLYCSGLTLVTLNNDYIVSADRASGTSLKSIFGNQVKEYVIGDGVTSIGDYAFYGCSGLTSVNIPNSVTSIGGWAFYGCSGLTSVTIPNSVTSIGDYTFYDCSGLTSVNIPNSVTSISEGAFQFCSGLTSVNIPNSVTSIGNYAFRNCSGLTSVTIPNSVTSIGSGAFSFCI